MGPWKRAGGWAAVLTLLFALLAAGCARPKPRPITKLSWYYGQEPGSLSPWGLPEPNTLVLRHLLYRGLVHCDRRGRVIPAAAERWAVSRDSLFWTFYLRPGLRFADGTPCQAEDFRAALENALQGDGGGSAAWLLWSVQGMARYRRQPGEGLVGIEVRDSSIVQLRLTRRDPALLEKLSHSLCSPVSRKAPSSPDLPPAGLGPYRAVRREDSRLVLVGVPGALTAPAYDTVAIEFGFPPRRVRLALRSGRFDLVWPIPAGLTGQAPPEGYALQRAPADPERWLLLVFRCDLPPTSRPEARRALAHALNRPALLHALGARGELGRWPWPDAPMSLPAQDAAAVAEWLRTGHLGRSLHVMLGFMRGSAGAEVARDVQAQWAEQSLDAELHAMTAEEIASALRGGGPHVLLAEDQPLTAEDRARLAAVVRPLRGPLVGSYRAGWPVRSFDAALWPRDEAAPLDHAAARRALEQDLPVLPLARLPWLWLAGPRATALGFHARYGPELAIESGVASR